MVSVSVSIAVHLGLPTVDAALPHPELLCGLEGADSKPPPLFSGITQSFPDGTARPSRVCSEQGESAEVARAWNTVGTLFAGTNNAPFLLKNLLLQNHKHVIL